MMLALLARPSSTQHIPPALQQDLQWVADSSRSSSSQLSRRSCLTSQQTALKRSRLRDASYLDLPSPGLDEAIVTIVDNRPSVCERTLQWVFVEAVSDECSIHCDPQWQLQLANGRCNTTIYFSTNFDWTIIANNYSMHLSFGDRGFYQVTLNPDGTHTLVTVVEPHHYFVPIIVAFFVLVGLNFVVRGVFHLFDTYGKERWMAFLNGRSIGDELERQPLTINQSEGGEGSAKLQGVAAVVRGKIRFTSLDVMRGITLSWMIFVNYGGGSYWFFDHSAWNGLTFADLLFPWFIFMMGTSAAVVLSNARKKKSPTASVIWNSSKRCVALFCFGLVVAASNGNNSVFPATDFPHLRIPGVLQRFAISYLVVASIMYFLPPYEEEHEDDTTNSNEHGVDNTQREWSDIAREAFVDVVGYQWQWLVIISLALLWVIITFWVPYGNTCPTGYVDPGGISDHGKHPDCTGGIATYIDQRIWGTDHIYIWGTYQIPYHVGIYAHDPEGTLGSLNSIVLVYFGAVAGRVLLRDGRKGRHRAVVTRLGAYGIVLTLLGGILCGFKQNFGPIPVCKNLWSTTFVLVTGGFAMWLLAILYAVVDVKQWWDGKPFLFLGMNSILVYMASELLQGLTSFQVPHQTHAWLLFSNITSVLAFTLFAYWLHCHRWYFSV